ncbi:MAG TPA: AMP-binding protein [Kiloniellales bacterium]|nr:AMP-binding protein [Kiloniellales bacterium]
MPWPPTPAALEALTGSLWVSVPEMIAARVRATPDAAFLAKGKRAWTYAEGWQESLRFAGLLAAEGYAGARVASFLPKAPEVLFAWFGCNALGGSFLAIDRQQKGDILTGLVERGRAPVLVTDRASFAEMPKAAQSLAELVIFADAVPEERPGQRRLDWSAVARAAPATPVPLRCDQPTVAIYTSGTTGLPKLVVIPHAMYTRGAAVMVDAFAYTQRDVFHDWMPLSHVGGQLHVTLCAICAGARLVMFERFSRHSFWQEVRAIGATVCGGFSNVIYLLSLPPPSPEDRRHSLRMGMIANNTPKAMADFEARFGFQVIDTYGMSECEPLTLPLFGEATPPGSCGRINPDFEVAVVDPATDRRLPVGEVGRVVVRPHVPHVTMQGYEGDPAATVAAWQNLWFHTQDLGRLDAEGFFYFVDRMKNAIRRGGENIAAVEVERVLKTHPEVADCGVVGIDDPVVGQEVKAVIVPVPGAAPAPAAIRAFALERMAAYMAPRYIELRDRLEYTEVGKVKRETLGPAEAPVWDARGA